MPSRMKSESHCLPPLGATISRTELMGNIPQNQERTAMTTIHPKRFAQLVRKWQRVRTTSSDNEAGCTTPQVTDKGHCAVYMANARRLKFSLTCLTKTIFGELLSMPQEELGFTCDGRITLPFDAAVMEYVMCLLRRNASEEVERPFLSSIVMPCQHPSSTVSLHQQLAVCSS
ncbi:unnamed protein product [Triticum turgidum subsp. durum]|uniref:Auxin-responsive protein n=1 Tax=Triticum turgidum subsp. durum TaxID=4567 RepID=A0A9R1APH3_TRITD|nr:unnamed protein product [Triticum turgidum subsp. durum]